MRIAVTGADGRLGREIVRAARSTGHEALPFGHGTPEPGADHGDAARRALEVTDPDVTAGELTAARPDAVVNCAGFTDVDAAEDRAGRALAVNAAGALHVARAAAGAGARLVQVSTDYVFSGEKGEPYHEADVPGGPVNVYGVSKLAGEELVRQAAPSAVVVRLAALFGCGGGADGGGDFVETVLGRARAGRDLWGVDDVRTSPTYGPDAARAVVALLDADASGVFHCTNRGETTWHGFARKALDLAGFRDTEVRRVGQSETNRPARRPLRSTLTSRREGPHRETMARSWEEALAGHLEGRVAQEGTDPYTNG